jgi:hypothetical protein
MSFPPLSTPASSWCLITRCLMSRFYSIKSLRTLKISRLAFNPNFSSQNHLLTPPNHCAIPQLQHSALRYGRLSLSQLFLDNVRSSHMSFHFRMLFLPLRPLNTMLDSGKRMSHLERSEKQRRILCKPCYLQKLGWNCRPSSRPSQACHCRKSADHSFSVKFALACSQTNVELSTSGFKRIR